MKTLQIRFKDEAYPKVIKALNKLGDIDLEITTEEDLLYLKNALAGIYDGSNKMYTLEEFEKLMDEVISEHENHDKSII